MQADECINNAEIKEGSGVLRNITRGKLRLLVYFFLAKAIIPAATALAQTQEAAERVVKEFTQTKSVDVAHPYGGEGVRYLFRWTYSFVFNGDDTFFGRFKNEGAAESGDKSCAVDESGAFSGGKNSDSDDTIWLDKYSFSGDYCDAGDWSVSVGGVGEGRRIFTVSADGKTLTPNKRYCMITNPIPKTPENEDSWEPCLEEEGDYQMIEPDLDVE